MATRTACASSLTRVGEVIHDQIGVSVATLRNWEQGRRMTIDEFLAEINDQKPPAPPAKLAAS